MAKDIDLNNLNFDGIETPEGGVLSDNQIPLTDEQLKLAQNEVDKDKILDSAILAGAAGAARGATFGLSDQALVKSGLVDAETLSELKRRSPIASTAGEVTGAIAPMLTPVGLAGKAVTGVAKAGLVAENFLAQAIAKSGSKVLAKSIIQKSLPKAAGSAVEGAAYGLGQLVSEEALGQADLNAENLIASAGLGALTGGVTGGTIGAIFGKKQAMAPMMSANGNLKDIGLKTINVSEPNYQAWRLAGKTPAQVTKLQGQNKAVFDNAQSYIQRRGVLDLTDSSANFFSKVSEDVNKLGQEIGDTLVLADDILMSKPELMLTKKQVGESITGRLEELKKSFKSLPLEESQKNVRRIDKDIRNIREAFGTSDPITGQELHNLKVQFQQQARWDKTGQLPVAEKIAREGSRALRDDLLKLADNVTAADPTSQIGSKLRQANLDYGTATELLSGLERKAGKDAERSLIDLKDSIFAGVGAAADMAGAAAGAIGLRKYAESDFRRKLNILTNVEKNAKEVATKIATSVDNFFSGEGGKAVPRSTSILTQSMLTRDLESRGEPKNKVEALQNLQKNIQSIKEDPSILQNILIRSTSHLRDTIPNTAENIDQVFMRALKFLDEKLPKQPVYQGSLQILSKKPWKPSSMETAKFERYMQALDNPLQALEDLKTKSLAPETVEVMKAVYPQLYGTVRDKIMEKAPQMADKLSYKQKAQLSLLMQAPIDSSFRPSSIASLQQNFIKPDEAQGQGMGGGSTKPLNSIGNMQSGTESVANRRSK